VLDGRKVLLCKMGREERTGCRNTTIYIHFKKTRKIRKELRRVERGERMVHLLLHL
jgi:bifunctional DNase/RNase